MPSPRPPARAKPSRSGRAPAPRTRRAARPQPEPDARDVRDRALAAALRLFAARGFDGTALQGIADAVGVAKPSLLHHFASKDALRQSVLEELLVRWNDVLPRLLLASNSGEGRFDRVLAEVVGFFAEDPDRARLLTREVLDRPAEMGLLVARHVPKWSAMVCGYIRKGQQEGSIHGGVDPEAYVVQVINLVVAGIATYDTIGALAGSGRDGSRGPARKLPARHVAELIRVAKSSLFVTSPPPAPPARRRPAR